MSIGCSSSYYSRMYKIVQESLDAALYVCNNNMDRFTDAKIFDVFDQTFPTAFILSTGYWIFFVSDCGAPLCVCGRFGIVCRHVRSKTHWIDLQPIAERTDSIVFTPKIYGPVIPRKYNITIDTAAECNGYYININMELIYTKKIRREFHINIQACYGYVYPCYGALFSIRFTPNPVLKENYGKYLDELRIHRAVLINRQFVDDLIVTPYSMPSAGLLLVNVNLIKYDIPAKISAVPLAEWEISKNNLPSKDASTQTQSETEYQTTISNELGLFRESLEDFTSSIWQYQAEAETQMLSHFMSHNIVLKSRETYPLGIDNSEQYDKQFPDMKIKASVNGKASTNPISEESIPKPVVSSFVQMDINQSKYPNANQSAEQTQLPKFQDVFQNCHYFAKPQSVRRRGRGRGRGRPKVPRSSNMVATNEKPAITSPIGSINTMSSLYSDNLTTTGSCMRQSSLEEEKCTKESDEQCLAEFDEIVKQVNEKCRFFSEEDFDNELDLINQLITEKMQNELIGSSDEISII